MTEYPALQLLIDGESFDGTNREIIDVIDPATGEVIAQLPSATNSDLAKALEATERGFRLWRSKSADEREAILRKGAQLIRERAKEIGAAITREQGKPIKEAVGETLYCAMLLEFYAGECKRLYGRTLVRNSGQRVEVRYEPVGPVAGFAAWNFPALNVVRKIGGPLAAGCSVIVKPSEETPAGGLAIVRAMHDAGVPGNALQCVFGVPSDISEQLLASPIIRKVTFTGSTKVGKHLAKLAAEDLKRTTLELGGHGPVLVFNNADVDKAIDTMAGNKYRNAGQVCVSPTRFLVQEDIFERFLDGFVNRAKQIKIGNGLESQTEMGPMSNQRGLDGIQEKVSDALSKGAKLNFGGNRVGNRGFFHDPTVLSQVPLDSVIMNDEPFGPVALINPMPDYNSMIEEANRLPYGLAAYAWTEDPKQRMQLSNDIEVGMIAINGGSVSASDAPFGGIKWSGYGLEDGAEGVSACLISKTIHETA